MMKCRPLPGQEKSGVFGFPVLELGVVPGIASSFPSHNTVTGIMSGDGGLPVRTLLSFHFDG
jgi:hypothetical protein